ncbi:RDD family protein [Fontimonas sp. SYSU GA230001]|uniref:RDD family protein n=1 Tax=Fontimonas sp. SYSU GA230001 TaxID=3142450 RepID=UPI0032B36D64
MHPSDPISRQRPGADPRDIITPDAFQVLPALYGLRLASPMRRLLAVGIDALLVAVIAQAGGLLLAMAAAVLFYGWMRAGSAPSGRGRRALRATAAALGAVILFAGALSVLQPLWERITGTRNGTAAEAGTLRGRDAVVAGVSLAQLQACADASCRQARFDELAAALARSRMPGAEQRELLDELAAATAADADEAARLRARAPAPAAPTPAPATAPGSDGDVPSPIHDGGISVLGTLRLLASELGFSFGWGAVYFTLLTVLWNGQTPGKRLLGIRVISLRGEPLTYWAAFERYGGYAAGFATGLLGFLQVFWDPNRQAIHDRICFTAVIRDPAGPHPARPRAAADNADPP